MGGGKPGALGSFSRSRRASLLFPAMNIYGLFSVLRTYRTRSNLAPGHRGSLLGFPGCREEAWRGLPVQGQGLMFRPSSTNLSGRATRPGEPPPFLAGRETSPEDFFILISRLDGGTNHSHHPRERPLVCPQKASRTPWPPEHLSPPPPLTCIGRSKLWKVRSFPLLRASAETVSTAGCLC